MFSFSVWRFSASLLLATVYVGALAQTTPSRPVIHPRRPAPSAKAPTLASLNLTCGDFKQNADRSWSPQHSLTVRGATMNPGASFNTGAAFNGVDLPALLNKECIDQ